jgi:GTPase
MDIGGAQIDFNCPDCGFINTATLGDVSNGASIICVGCLRTIQFVDGDGDTKRAVDEVEQAFNDLGKAFRHGH